MKTIDSDNIGLAIVAATVLGCLGLRSCQSPDRTDMSGAILAQAIFVAEYNLASMEQMAGHIESHTWSESERRRRAAEIREYVAEMHVELDKLKQAGGGR